MKNKSIHTTLLFILISWPLAAQFNLHVTTSFASTRYHPTLPTVNLTYFPDKASFTFGAEAEFKFRGQKKRQAYLSLRSGISYLQAGYDYVQVFPEDDFETTSLLEKDYLRIPAIARLYYQPMPLVDHFTLFLGGGVVINKVQNISLSESYISPTEKYADSQDVLAYSKPQYLFSIVEMGVAYKRIEVSFRIQSALESLYMEGLEGNWGVPNEYSEYFKRHLSESPIESTEKILELTVSYKIF
jgi:hypothetical protein